MTDITRRSLLATAAIAAPAVLVSRRARAASKLRVSLDTTPQHIRTKQIGRWLEIVQEKSGGEIEPELFHSGQLYRDRDVGKALRQGSVEMCVPGTWVLTGIEPNADFGTHPALYGQPRETIYKISDGEYGTAVNSSLEDKLRARVVGRWLDLGASNSYAVTELVKPEDLKGMKVRTSGGHGQFLRANFFEAVPAFVAWPDVPLAMSQGAFEGMFSTSESCASAKLWDSGLKYALLDHQFYAQYVPLISESFIEDLSDEMQALVADSWEANIDAFRDEANEAQDEATRTMAENGVTVTTPEPAKLREIRERMLETTDEYVKELNVDPEMAEMITAAAAD